MTKCGACGIKRGVSLYSYQEEYFLRKMNLEDCLVAVSALHADGVEMLGEQMVPDFPDPAPEFIDRWFDWMEKYKLKPTAYDSFLDTKLYKNRLLTEDECVAMMARDIKLASQMGFNILRTLVSTPRKVIERSLPLAERCDVKIGIEVHAPFSLKSAWIDEFMELAEQLETPYFGIIPDMGIFVRRLPPVYLGWHKRHGATPHIVDYIAEAYADRTEKEVAKAEVVRMGGNEVDRRLSEQAFHFSCDDPRWLLKYIPRILHIHAKFYEMTPECVEPSIPYEEIIAVLEEGRYRGYLSSEYEGQRHIQDLGETDSVEQVSRQHTMFRKLLVD
jgi:sugar phosphate isomerase/epimerase